MTKSKRIRSIPLNDKAKGIILERLKYRDGENVFTYNGKTMTLDFISKKFKKYVIRSGIDKRLTFHSLRHTFASWLVQKGVSIFLISKLLGHSDMRVTQIYSHLRPEDLLDTVKLL